MLAWLESSPRPMWTRGPQQAPAPAPAPPTTWTRQRSRNSGSSAPVLGGKLCAFLCRGSQWGLLATPRLPYPPPPKGGGGMGGRGVAPTPPPAHPFSHLFCPGPRKFAFSPVVLGSGLRRRIAAAAFEWRFCGCVQRRVSNRAANDLHPRVASNAGGPHSRASRIWRLRVDMRKVTAVGFEPTPLRTGALSQRLRPLGQTVLLACLLKKITGGHRITRAAFALRTIGLTKGAKDRERERERDTQTDTHRHRRTLTDTDRH